MKTLQKVVIGVLVVSVLLVPAMSYAQGLTNAQVTAILGLLQAFNADQSVLLDVQNELMGNTTQDMVQEVNSIGGIVNYDVSQQGIPVQSVSSTPIVYQSQPVIQATSVPSCIPNPKLILSTNTSDSPMDGFQMPQSFGNPIPSYKTGGPVIVYAEYSTGCPLDTTAKWSLSDSAGYLAEYDNTPSGTILLCSYGNCAINLDTNYFSNSNIMVPYESQLSTKSAYTWDLSYNGELIPLKDTQGATTTVTLTINDPIAGDVISTVQL